MNKPNDTDMLNARRRFLATCGKFAAITPPAMTVLLASTAQNYAVAGSGGGGGAHLPSGHGNNGFGNGGGDGVPGRSGSNPSPQAPSKAADKNR
jgi:hypothetical protein